ncbi:hypothetical protein D8M04_04055 [Oceanobacillus piezotolerans]|uniref:Uncharacterized protein n=1 Tax=Oceanobacillus piezotolerans TaxID=2448030 RepID=A0A498DE08_9BACI|nr:hypothetical protein [Oceanobacillus piezotolerans]RLL48442.1 hypothetical protein D8M04_04055 [Oceanobacillus piezotolerans]
MREPRKRFNDVKPHQMPKHFGHSLIGPVYIRDAKSHQTLKNVDREVSSPALEFSYGEISLEQYLKLE